ncbi:hydroxyacylglutathione hydrolase [Marinicella sediminis]|uniref:Hydroxyacylglutathione hydrolase n=1 Tax=Marinicella sediminis TaxID=1792834 RepID=A0ABV7JBS8_9GAMM|nr:hydroxyacylglutathione hydrolase [Marinicella sediminis]
MSLTIHPIPAFNDNYIWIVHDGSHAVVIDPGDAQPVKQYLQDHQLDLTTILITHHHYDHVDGVSELCGLQSCDVFAPQDQRMPFAYQAVSEGDDVCISAPKLELKVVETPGHTLTHICYYDQLRLFCGDTLFSAGCGRMFEGTAEQFVSSLNKLKNLPPSLLVFCTHEYTLSNLLFAQHAEPDNTDIRAHQNTVNDWRSEDKPSLPSTLALELKINPFLRTHLPDVQKNVSHHWQTVCDDETRCFALLRKWKDSF